MYICGHGLSSSVPRGDEERRSVLMSGCYTERWLEHVVVGACFQSSGSEYMMADLSVEEAFKFTFPL